MLEKPANLIIICGHYGSGKTNVAVNLAVRMREKYPEKKVYAADLDIVNPYFRTADAAELLRTEGIEPLIPEFANTNVDIPSLPPKLYQLLEGKNEDEIAIIDVGGDDGSVALGMYSKLKSPVLDYRVDHTKWCVLRYPIPSLAQSAGMSQEAFADFYYKVCTLDYKKMSQAMDALVDLMNRTDKVQLKGPGTDLTFSIKGIGAKKCAGRCNIPDGEVYSAPVKDSMNGYITYNTVSLEEGFTYDNIYFEVKDGKIVKATAHDTERINAHLDTDEGARYFGEFAIGVNPYILEPMKDTLFDEKIAGSFHLTPGMCYEDAPNGNKSAIHWDLVMIQRPEYGGGEIWFDDVLIRKDGLFVVPELECLNPENLK